jgi:hypothetical protein
VIIHGGFFLVSYPPSIKPNNNQQVAQVFSRLGDAFARR